MWQTFRSLKSIWILGVKCLCTWACLRSSVRILHWTDEWCTVCQGEGQGLQSPFIPCHHSLPAQLLRVNGSHQRVVVVLIPTPSSRVGRRFHGAAGNILLWSWSSVCLTPCRCEVLCLALKMLAMARMEKEMLLPLHTAEVLLLWIMLSFSN